MIGRCECAQLAVWTTGPAPSLLEDYADHVFYGACSPNDTRIVFRGVTTLIPKTETLLKSSSLILVKHADAFGSQQ